MLFRFSPFRGLTVVTAFSFITCLIFLRWLFSHSSENIIGSYYDKQNGRLSLPPAIFSQAPMYNELVEIQFHHFRISPSELNKPVSKRYYIAETLSYDEKVFRQSTAPILWLDEHGDVRWNRAAENGMISYLIQKQFPKQSQLKNTSLTKEEILKICRPSSLFVLHQHWSGFFSRVLCFIAQFGQTLYSPRIATLQGTRFSGDRGEKDDFLGEGIKRYFLPFSICSNYELQSDMTDFRKRIQSDEDKVLIARSRDLHEHGGKKEDRALYSVEFWKMDYHHVPIRKWLFNQKKTSISYNSPINILSDHSNEHIYAPKNEKNVSIGDWILTNKPDAFSSDLLPNRGHYKLTWQDYVFGSFLRYMFVLFFGSQNAPRIEIETLLLKQHWKSYLTDKYTIPRSTNPFDKLAGLYIRRGDKHIEDSFWFKHRHWRNVSFYVKGIVDEEQRRKTKFDYIFVMTDDASVMTSIQDYANPKSTETDEPYARQHLLGRDILYNVFAPQLCFDPFLRIGFDQFLVSMRFLIDYSAFTIGHTDSNVFRFFREVIYAQRQHWPNLQSFTYVQNAPDTFDVKNKTGTKKN